MSFPSPPADPAGEPPVGAAESGGGVVLASDDGDPYWWLGSLTLTKVTGAQTHGGVDVVDHRVPAGYTPPRHVHHGQDEIFYIIDGQFTVHCADRTWQAGPGSVIFLPRDVPHGFEVSAAGPGRTLLINAPARFADVITGLGDPASTLTLPGPDVARPDPARVAAVEQAHGITSAAPAAGS